MSGNSRRESQSSPLPGDQHHKSESLNRSSYNKSRPETLEEKIARVMADINMPAPVLSSSANETQEHHAQAAAKDESSEESYLQLSNSNKSGGARIVKPTSSNSLSSVSETDERNGLPQSQDQESETRNTPDDDMSSPTSSGEGTLLSEFNTSVTSPQHASSLVQCLTTPEPAPPSDSKSSKNVWSVIKRSVNDSFVSSSKVMTLTKGGRPDLHHSVRVAVRIRPFTVGEIKSGPRRVVSVNGEKLILVNPKAFTADPDAIAAAAAAVSLEDMRCNDWAKVFCFDHCLWSYDPTDEENTYVNQRGVYDSIGAGMAEDVMRGVSTCCFAYGHTSTGKTYTMFGGDDLIHSEGGGFIQSEDEASVQLHESAGLIPRVFLDIVENVFSDDEVIKDTKITLSFLEIYQEKIRDCLAPSTSTSDLRVREHPALGPYVEKLTKVEVESATEVLELLYRGYEERSTASTFRNRHSSRSHAIATLELSPVDDPDPFSPSFSKSISSTAVCSVPQVRTVQKHAHVRAQMVDLAGSEKEVVREDLDTSGRRKRYGTSQRSSGNTERLELKMIRRSLSTLGYIIKELGKGNSAKGLPFRDSVLTWLLRDALSGRSNTTMLATISPSHTCYDESLHTLKYAERLCQLSVVSMPGMESFGRVGINDTIDPNLTYTLATEFSKLKGELGGNKPGSKAARHLLQQTIADPQQRLARLDPYKISYLMDDARYSAPGSVSRHRPISSGSVEQSCSKDIVVKADDVGMGSMDPDLKEAYRQLHGKYIEIQIELDNARTDRDGMKVELQNAQEYIQRTQAEKFIGSKSATSDFTKALRAAEEDIAELKGIILRKEETAERLLSELNDERQARATVEKTARSQVAELIERLEALHKQGQSVAKDCEKWQQECQILRKEKEAMSTEMLELKTLMAEKNEDAGRKISSLQDELRLSMNDVTNAIKERDQINAELNSIVEEKTNLLAREVVLTRRIQELQLGLEKVSNESKLKSELDIIKLERDSLLEVIKQQEHTLVVQQQQSEASLKMLHQRQAALDRYEQRSEGEHDELTLLHDNLQQLLAQEGQTLYSELVDAKKLISVISSVRVKVSECRILKETIAELEDEKLQFEDRVKALEMDRDQWVKKNESVVEQVNHLKKQAIDWEARAHYWQQVAKKKNSISFESRAADESQSIISATSMQATVSQDYSDLRSENASLREHLRKSLEELENTKSELMSSKDDKRKEFSSLLVTVEQFNKRDASKDKALAEAIAARDAAVKEKMEIERAYITMKREYESLQSELQSIDLDLLDVADNEGIEVGAILHVVHDNHPHVPHGLSDEYFSKHPDSSQYFNRHSKSTTSLQHREQLDPRLQSSGHTNIDYRRGNGSMLERSTRHSVVSTQSSHTISTGKEMRRRRKASALQGHNGPSMPSALIDEDVTEKGLEMQIEELSQFLSKDSNRARSHK